MDVADAMDRGSTPEWQYPGRNCRTPAVPLITQVVGAEGGTRTHTLFRAADFESAASTSSATSAREAKYRASGWQQSRWPGPPPAVGARRRSCRSIELQCLGAAPVPVALDRHEGAAGGHLAAVDVQGDGDVAVAGIADGMVLVWRDQAAGRADTGGQRAAVLETHLLVLPFHQLVLGDLQGTGHHAFHAPQTGVVVHRRALAGPPGHGDDRVAQVGAAVDLPACVVFRVCLEDRRRQVQALLADQTAQGLLQTGGEFGAGVAPDGFIQGGDEGRVGTPRRARVVLTVRVHGPRW